MRSSSLILCLLTGGKLGGFFSFLVGASDIGDV